MARNEIVVIANDVVPGQSLPVAAPGLRAAGIAAGLRAQGHDVVVLVDGQAVRRASTGALPAPRPPGSVVLEPRQFEDFIRVRRPGAVVVTNSNHVERLGSLKKTHLVYDFFAPKMLELAQHPATPEREEQLTKLRRRKLAALAKSSAVIVNGAKKVPYVMDWLERSGNTAALDRLAVVNMPVRTRASDPVDDGRVHMIIAGYIQPWSRPGDWQDALLPFLKDGSLALHMLVSAHWGGRVAASQELPAAFEALSGVEGVIKHGPLEYTAFERLLSSCHVSIDLFERNPERELAMVTRTAVSLSCGLPVLHVPFTETGEIVRAYDAGWLVDGDDVGGVSAALEDATANPDHLDAKRRNAARAAAEVFDPVVAVEPLHRILGELL